LPLAQSAFSPLLSAAWLENRHRNKYLDVAAAEPFVDRDGIAHFKLVFFVRLLDGDYVIPSQSGQLAGPQSGIYGDINYRRVWFRNPRNESSNCSGVMYGLTRLRPVL